VAHKTGALATGDLERVVVDTTVQPKAIAHPSDARLCHLVAPREMLGASTVARFFTDD
jgi:hypothetical protein